MDAILAIDPGSAVSGWAMLSVGPNPEPILRGDFHFTKPTKGQHEHPSALVRFLYEEAAVRMITVLGAVIEDQYLGKNVDTLKKISRNAGRWEEAIAGVRVPLQYVAPSTWQSKELGLRGARRDALRRAADAKAFGLWGIEASEHVVDACLLARYVALTMYYKAFGRKAS